MNIELTSLLTDIYHVVRGCIHVHQTNLHINLDFLIYHNCVVASDEWAGGATYSNTTNAHSTCVFSCSSPQQHIWWTCKCQTVRLFVNFRHVKLDSYEFVGQYTKCWCISFSLWLVRKRTHTDTILWWYVLICRWTLHYAARANGSNDGDDRCDVLARAEAVVVVSLGRVGIDSFIGLMVAYVTSALGYRICQNVRRRCVNGCKRVQTQHLISHAVHFGNHFHRACSTLAQTIRLYMAQYGLESGGVSGGHTAKMALKQEIFNWKGYH